MGRLEKRSVSILLSIILLILCGLVLTKSPTLIAIPIILMLGIWIVFHPEHGLILMVIVLPLQRGIFGPYAYGIVWLPLIALLLSIIFYNEKKKTVFEKPRIKLGLQYYFPLIVYLLFYLYSDISYYFRASSLFNTWLPSIQMLTSQSMGNTFHRYSFQALLLLIVMALIPVDLTRLRTIIRINWGVATVLAVLGLMELILPYSINLYVNNYFWHGQSTLQNLGQNYRVMSIFWDPNHLGNFLVTSAFICLPVLFIDKEYSFRKTIMVISTIIVGIATFFTFSIGTWLSLIIGTLALFIFLPTKKSVKAAVVVLLLIFSLSCLVIFGIVENPIPPWLQEKASPFSRITGGVHELETGAFETRATLVQAGYHLFTESPVFGKGMGSYQFLAPMTGLVRSYRPITYPHNSYILILAELGIVGMFLFLVFIYSIFRMALMNKKLLADSSLGYLQIGVIAAIVSNLVFFLTYESAMYNLIFWLAIGLTMMIRKEVVNETAKNS